MPFKPNYRQQRSERDRAKDRKKQDKLRKREEDTARRKTETEPGGIDGEAAGAADPAERDE